MTSITITIASSFIYNIYSRTELPTYNFYYIHINLTYIRSNLPAAAAPSAVCASICSQNANINQNPLWAKFPLVQVRMSKLIQSVHCHAWKTGNCRATQFESFWSQKTSTKNLVEFLQLDPYTFVQCTESRILDILIVQFYQRFTNKTTIDPFQVGFSDFQ